MINVLIATYKPWVGNLYASHISSIDEFEVVGTVGSVDAIKDIYKNSRIDLIVLDVSDNLSFMKELKSLKLNSDIIPLTYFREMRNLGSYLKFGMVDYLIKPFEFKEFKKVFENYYQKSGNIKDRGDGVIIKDSLAFATSLNKRTLDRINDFMKINKKFMTTSEIGGQLKLSITTVRKYLKYLHTVEKITRIVHQENSKRPLCYYKHLADEI